MKKAWIAGFLLICLCTMADARIDLRAPFPNDRALDVGQPTLFWSVAGPNLLQNGSFEDGTNGWILPARNWQVGPRSSAYDGTNMLMLYGGTVARDITLPQTTSAILWTFGVRTSGTTPPIPMFVAEVQTPEGEVLLREDFLRQGHESSSDNPRFWRGAVDLSAFAARTVRIALVFTPSSTYEASVDDWRVEVFPEGVAFDLYVMESQSTNMVKRARTESGSLALTNLWPSRAYQWRVDAIFNGQTNTGPLWTFATRSPGRAGKLELAQLPDIVRPNRELTVNAFLRDTNGLALFPSRDTFSLLAAADNVPPTALITEVNASTNAEVEIANVSTNLLDLSGWRVRLLSTTVDGTFVWVPTNSFLAPGEMFTIRRQDYAKSAWPRLGIGSTSWRDTNAAGVILLDATSNIVDSVFIDRTPTTNPGWGALRFKVTPIDWRGLMLENAAEGLTYQRIGNSDSNTRDDWTVAASSVGTVNAGMTLPFAPGFGRAPATFGSNAIVVKDIPALTTSVTFPIALSNVWLLASQAVPAGGAEGASLIDATSQIFQVADSQTVGRWSMIIPEQIVEGGTQTLTISMATPPSTPQQFRLTSSRPDLISVPEEIIIDAGVLETLIQFHALPAPGLDRVEEVQIVVMAAGLESATNVIKVLIEQIDSGQIESAAIADDGASFRIRFTTRTNWIYSLGQAFTLDGSWDKRSESVTGDGALKDFTIPKTSVPPDYPAFFRIFREPPAF